MCQHLQNNNQREIYIETIREKLIGPGTENFGPDVEQEQIATIPTKLYYSGILFSKGFTPDTEEPQTQDVVLEQPDENDDLQDDLQNGNTNSNQGEKDDVSNERFQTFYSNKIGMVFALNQQTDSITVHLSYATYEKTAHRLLKLSQEEWTTLASLIQQLKDSVDFQNALGANFFDDIELNYDPVNQVLSCNLTNNIDLNLAKDTINAIFANNKALKNKFFYQLLATDVYKRTPVTLAPKIIDLNNHEDNYELDGYLNLHLVKRTNNGKKIIKLLLVNNDNKKAYSSCYYQVELKVESSGLETYKNPLQLSIDEDFTQVEYQYQDVHTFGKGINCAVHWKQGQWIATTFLPQVDINSFSNSVKQDQQNTIGDILQLKNLSIWSTLSDDQILTKLSTFIDEYDQWINQQDPYDPQDTVGAEIKNKQLACLERLKANILFLQNDKDVLESFKLANTAMFIQMIIAKDNRFEKGRAYENVNTIGGNIFDDLAFFANYNDTYQPAYYPFQLAFLLMNIEPTFNKQSPDRLEKADLIWFPTGGGKTEAYLALTALTIIERKRHNQNLDTAGISVIMRYTLRLLTAQQFERATWLICALEFLRKKEPALRLGKDPITIGMWVGSSTTPNKLEELSNSKWGYLLKQKTIEGAKKVNRFPIAYCPWCGCDLVKFENNNIVLGFEKIVNRKNITNLITYCVNQSCHFFYNDKKTGLPIIFIDEIIYKNPPTLLFATVDKMVQLSRKKEAKGLFEKPLPPDLIIQDELHLLTGPLGSLTALYEVLIERICTKLVNGVLRKPKIVASTATTRNTKPLIKSMFGRELIVFPAQGKRFNDNYFSYIDTKSKRRHLGVLPTGKTAGLTEIKLVEALYEAKLRLLQCFLREQGVDTNDITEVINALNTDQFKHKVDPYWTFVLYYNNLRDLGRSKSRVGIDFKQQIKGLYNKKDIDPVLNFVHYNMFVRTVEFTSRQESGKIKGLLNQLEQPVSFECKIDNNKNYVNETGDSIDLALASNMFSVGIDVKRLNIMLMVGQPGSVSEYIQSSSRVARKDEGLVINLLNPMRVRELSIFEDYTAFHYTYYKNVEPLSITPFTTMAVDKLLEAIFVGYMRIINDVNQVSTFNTTMKDDIKNYISDIKTARLISDEQEEYILQKIDRIANTWSNKQNILNPPKNIIKEDGSANFIYDIMNSLRDIDYDVYIENKSL